MNVVRTGLVVLATASWFFAEQAASGQDSDCGQIKEPSARLACYDGRAVSVANDPSAEGTIEGTITWQYNKFVGTRGDKGARVLLLKKPLEETVKKITSVSLLTFGIASDREGFVYSVEADGYGRFMREGISAGEYFVLIKSGETRAGPDDFYTNECKNELQKFSSETLTFFNKAACQTVRVVADRRVQIVHDFGNTYF
jgi:hypothetical protein